MQIHCLPNPGFGSNTYIIELANNKALIIDPGNPDINPVKDWLTQNNRQIESVILTHEHSDHCAGVNALYEWSPFELICTEATAKNIASNRQNFSYYIDKNNAFEINLPGRIVRDGDSIYWEAQRFDFFETPGHSPGGLCIKAGNTLFTGDTLLNQTKTPLCFPHSNKNDYHRSKEKLKNILIPGMTIYPGHGDAFIWNTLQT